ncbi:amidohydrolase [Xanthomonas hyacinthi]|uniref:Amidohydrolase n=1 Tax=Xanthomonas hyacinthi TaxID=56455 RepID=A0A2S7EXR6_9XANT|nr:M20 aminoacylase family protein [Xanthomonas hyacinthi]PPU97903.1 amidohydrolase [Xanthomonas hyacinthi]QGY76561.1 amidohydrolase [Xanthomonas hyacinthi]
MSALPQAPIPGSGVIPQVAAFSEDQAIALRHDFHRHPELAFEEHRTSARIAGLLSDWGYDVVTGIGGTGVVGTLRRGGGTRRLGLRADFDALPISEDSGLAYASQTPGLMHACGHDGHTTILLAAAYYLARHGRFDGTVHLVFQPAEEVGKGAARMLADGLFERFPVDAIFGLHNWPGVPAGRFGFVEGPAMASVDWARIRVLGKGGHGAEPQTGVDPVLAAAHIVTALQSVVARNVDPREMAVITVGSIHGGQAANVIPDSVELKLTVRAFLPEVRQALRRRIPALVEAVAAGFGASVDIEFPLGFPSVLNHAAETAFARGVALQLFGEAGVVPGLAPRTASEDFAFLLQQRPGSFLFVGNGDSASLHSPRYVFNDAIIAPAASYWARLAEAFLAEPA